MDYFFNKKIPNSSESELIFPPGSKTFVSGLASSYSFSYDSSFMSPYMKETQFNFLMNSLNDELFSYWPCSLCFYFGYACSPCTLGLSFLCPNSCISTAKEHFINKIEYYNSQHFEPKGLRLSYHQTCSTSWVKLSILSSGGSLRDINTNKINEKENEFQNKNDITISSIDTQNKFLL